jgi:hypothetical protein
MLKNKTVSQASEELLKYERQMMREIQFHI